MRPLWGFLLRNGALLVRHDRSPLLLGFVLFWTRPFDLLSKVYTRNWHPFVQTLVVVVKVAIELSSALGLLDAQNLCSSILSILTKLATVLGSIPTLLQVRIPFAPWQYILYYHASAVASGLLTEIPNSPKRVYSRSTLLPGCWRPSRSILRRWPSHIGNIFWMHTTIRVRCLWQMISRSTSRQVS